MKLAQFFALTQRKRLIENKTLCMICVQYDDGVKDLYNITFLPFMWLVIKAWLHN